MLADNPQHEPPANELPLPWLLVAVVWTWLLALALFVAT